MTQERSSSNLPSGDFYKRHSVEQLIQQQGTGPVDLDAVRAEFSELWPDDASIEAFLAFLQNPHE